MKEPDATASSSATVFGMKTTLLARGRVEEIVGRPLRQKKVAGLNQRGEEGGRGMIHFHAGNAGAGHGAA
jgi:hypothetical protein